MLVNSSRTLKIFFSILSFLLELSMTSARPRHLDLRGRPIESSHGLLAELLNDSIANPRYDSCNMTHVMSCD